MNCKREPRRTELSRADVIELQRFKWFVEQAHERMQRGASRDEAEGAALAVVYPEDAPQ